MEQLLCAMIPGMLLAIVFAAYLSAQRSDRQRRRHATTRSGAVHMPGTVVLHADAV